ncbi:Hypothetical protein, putative [Bodo saltans]|uniref:Uncharacterized protein n=1 Tax=Bodo saltans TaxID=75058 RepID=A0A0S4IKS6_BODSA|nr:Hypothetical protein, putative [Bodo saltans]|eukprot:CUE66479.1 Hypothetical protein, putative [Bodo saltans]
MCESMKCNNNKFKTESNETACAGLDPPKVASVLQCDWKNFPSGCVVPFFFFASFDLLSRPPAAPFPPPKTDVLPLALDLEKVNYHSATK